jgi:hypothetical protein
MPADAALAELRPDLRAVAGRVVARLPSLRVMLMVVLPSLAAVVAYSST